VIGCGTVTGPIDGDLAMLIGVLGETPSGPAVGFTALPRRPVTTTLQSLIHQDVPLCGMAVRHGCAAWPCGMVDKQFRSDSMQHGKCSAGSCDQALHDVRE